MTGTQFRFSPETGFQGIDTRETVLIFDPWRRQPSRLFKSSFTTTTASCFSFVFGQQRFG